MTNERELNPQREPQNWILHHGNYQGHRFSALKEINTDTVKNLKPVFTVALSGFQSGGRYAFGNLEATPIVEDGIMYVTGRLGLGLCDRRDRRQERQSSSGRWIPAPTAPGPVMSPAAGSTTAASRCGRTRSSRSRSMAACSRSTRLPAKSVWERKIADPAVGETLTMAPLVIRDLAIVGVAGGEFGIRGYHRGDRPQHRQGRLAHLHHSRQRRARQRDLEGRQERGSHGGGSVWETATYDPETDTIYQGIGNAGPDWDAEYRPGDNIWTDSVLAMNPDDGKIKWGFQYTPNDPLILTRSPSTPSSTPRSTAKTAKLVVHAARNGFFYALDRING